MIQITHWVIVFSMCQYIFSFPVYSTEVPLGHKLVSCCAFSVYIYIVNDTILFHIHNTIRNKYILIISSNGNTIPEFDYIWNNTNKQTKKCAFGLGKDLLLCKSLIWAIIYWHFCVHIHKISFSRWDIYLIIH